MTIVTKYEMGDELKDIVTGYQGVVLCIAHYSTGCTHYSLQPKGKLDKEGKEPLWQGFDESRLVKVGKGIRFSDAKPKSGPVPSMPRERR